MVKGLLEAFYLQAYCLSLLHFFLEISRLRVLFSYDIGTLVINRTAYFIIRLTMIFCGKRLNVFYILFYLVKSFVYL